MNATDNKRRDAMSINDLPETVCPRCAGAGRFECFATIEAGICFQCRGRGVVCSRPRAVKAPGRRGPPLEVVRVWVGDLEVEYYPTRNKIEVHGQHVEGTVALRGPEPLWMGGITRLDAATRAKVLAVAG